MKKIFLGMATVALLATACNNNKNAEENADTMAHDHDAMTSMDKPEVREGEYVNLASGEKVNIVRDPETGIAVDSKTQLPVEFYYDPVSLDTMYQNGMVVNSMLIKEKEGKYRLNDTKIKIDGDEIKVKTDSSKLKIDGDEMKMKSPDSKMKVDGEDGKLKTDDTKIKVEDGETKVKSR
ncbi:hypothetical protein BCY91_04810 [Pelobium manganitolerans]|uniref:LPS export ABC transporter periplasmic protein LptC n=1 Tax=Pelobium manganitolerans TaxID=1842495 RepID=A0A419S5W6_9SPHI|nr:hypothetical protein [Pelobium manganitolerans]RKD16203.1 hypothetical protein BCY91_04810 [Pelobium manganitolerans]